MRIFVTGGSGFIGRYLIPLLIRKGHEVLSLGRGAKTQGASRTLQGDLYETDSYRAELEFFKPESAIHLAWGGLPDYSLGNCRRNLLAGIGLFEALGQAGCTKIFSAGSCWEYGKLTGAVKESDLGEGTGMFAAFKIALQVIGHSFCQADGHRFIWGRPFFVYGPGQRANSLIPSCYRSLSAGIAPSINNPMAINDYVYVTDVAEAILTLIEESEAAGTYNIGTGKPTAVWEVVNAVATSLGLSPPYHNMHPSQATGLWADTHRMEALGWRPAVTLEAGINHTIETWKIHGN
jgi:nucleoside-diphosphate-sugar epimerase